MSNGQNKERMLKRLYRIFDLLMPDFENCDDYLSYPFFNPKDGIKLSAEISKLEGFYAAEKKSLDFGRSDPQIMEALELGLQVLSSRHDNEKQPDN